MIDIAVLRAMASAGAGVEAILAAIETDQKAELERLAAQREANRQKQKRHRNRRNGYIRLQDEPKDEKSLAINDRVTDVTVTSPYNPLKERKKEREEVVVDLAATRRVPPSAERGAVTEYDLVLSDGGGIITHEEFQALNEEFGITNARDRASAAKRGYLSGVKNAGEFMSRFRSALINAKNRSKTVKKTVAQQVDTKAAIEDEYAERQRRLAARNRIIGGGSAR